MYHSNLRSADECWYVEIWHEISKKSLWEIGFGCDLRKYFTLIVSGEQFKESKPNPEIYLHAIKELNVNKDEAIIIEDSPKGILAANRAGIKVLALKDDKFGLDQSQADIIINELNDIIKLIEKGA